MTDWTIVLLVALTALMCGWMVVRIVSAERKTIAVRDAAVQAGLIEPPSLHPVIDPQRCIGCGSCVHACPEGSILGLIQGKAELVEPTHCIGHGACADSCAPKAIELVFGSERRGVDIPFVDQEFQTNVPGMFIAGELGGMGLIRNAVEQGRQALEAVRKHRLKEKSDHLDVVIVGAGPAGFSASLAALEHGLKFVTVEQETLGGTVAHYPRGKIVMTAPVQLPLIGKVNFRETTKEALLEFWESAEAKSGVRIQYQERVESIQKSGETFRVVTSKGTYESRAVLLAIGRRGTPRKLGVEGEQLEKVVYRLIDPAQFQGQHVLVVGGGDSALEAACSCADEPGTTVTLSYRSEAFGRAKLKNRERVTQLVEAGRLRTILPSNVKRITPDQVEIESLGRIETIDNNVVIVCAGGILPTPFLQSIGIEIETKYGTA